MEKKGRTSSTWNSRHVTIKYFFVRDHVDKEEVKIEYYPTGFMLADFLRSLYKVSCFINSGT